MAKKPAGKGLDTDSIKAKLAEIRVKKMAELEEEQAEILSPLQGKIDEQEAIIKEAQSQIAEINKIISSISGKPAKGGSSSAGGVRERRSTEQMNQQATEVLEFIKSKGAKGASGSEIKSQFKGITNVKELVERIGVKLKDNGAPKRSMIYFAP
jgi:SMC interacting uncharacterized protein involved in chromosome segregation